MSKISRPPILRRTYLKITGELQLSVAWLVDNLQPSSLEVSSLEEKFLAVTVPLLQEPHNNSAYFSSFMTRIIFVFKYSLKEADYNLA